MLAFPTNMLANGYEPMGKYANITMCQYANKQRYDVSSLTYWHIAILTH